MRVRHLTTLKREDTRILGPAPDCGNGKLTLTRLCQSGLMKLVSGGDSLGSQVVTGTRSRVSCSSLLKPVFRQTIRCRKFPHTWGSGSSGLSSSSE